MAAYEDPHADSLYVVCASRECRDGAGQYVKIVAFNTEEEVIFWARDHHEKTGHLVLVPFKIYERKGK